jgi:hypothetical protein
MPVPSAGRSKNLDPVTEGVSIVGRLAGVRLICEEGQDCRKRTEDADKKVRSAVSVHKAYKHHKGTTVAEVHTRKKNKREQREQRNANRR